VIVVQNTAGVAYYEVLDTRTCTASSTCAAQPPGPIPAGTYNWFVKASNSYGASDWSAGRTITIN
jgi:hypothetical protein